eukprot:1375302-Prymnesium_polylepis.4
MSQDVGFVLRCARVSRNAIGGVRSHEGVVRGPGRVCGVAAGARGATAANMSGVGARRGRTDDFVSIL